MGIVAMIFGVLFGFAALGLFSAAFGNGQTDTHDPVTSEGLDVAGSENGDPLDAGDGNDVLAGEGGGDDHVTFGTGDEVSGGAGADLFETGDWVLPGVPATIADYDPEEDLIAYSLAGPTPEITTEIAADGTATVSANGAPFLIVPNAGPGFTPAEIDLQERTS